VLGIDRELRRITLSHRELLGTWEENAALFRPGETVAGIVRGVEEYGSFIELTPNLSGLAEKREGLKEGEGVSVYIKSIITDRMKIKLLVIDSFGQCKAQTKLRYFISGGHIDHWRYSPESCEKKVIERIF
jgi:small subunit ribosomal protein S1